MGNFNKPDIDVLLPYGEQELLFRVPEKNLLAVLTPQPVSPQPDPGAEIRRALANPIGMPRLVEAAKNVQKVVIIADDLTRQTPLKLIIPELLVELNRAGVRDEQVTILIALGTHRPMTPAEILAHFGQVVTARVTILNHPWQDPAQLVDLGETSNGTPVQICRLALEADFLIGLGSIVPHHIPGFSGGAKIIQPGISGAATTGATHFFSTRTRRSYLGLAENPVRMEMETIAERVGLRAILNVVLDPRGCLLQAFFGDFRAAHQVGVEFSRRVYGVPYRNQADIVVASSHPCDIEFWQAHKSLYPADTLVREGGTIIVVTPCPEGVSITHQDMLQYTALSPEKIESLVQSGEIKDVASGALALAWAKVRQHARICLVSDGISRLESEALGFAKYESLEDAFQSALQVHGVQSSVYVLPHAPDSLPVQMGTG
jgi:lactate racemase